MSGRRDSIRNACEQVADVIAARIASGAYSVRLPAERALAVEFDVSYTTVRYAAVILRERGLIITRQGRGTFVASWVAARREPGGRP